MQVYFIFWYNGKGTCKSLKSDNTLNAIMILFKLYLPEI